MVCIGLWRAKQPDVRFPPHHGRSKPITAIAITLAIRAIPMPAYISLPPRRYHLKHEHTHSISEIKLDASYPTISIVRDLEHDPRPALDHAQTAGGFAQGESSDELPCVRLSH